MKKTEQEIRLMAEEMYPDRDYQYSTSEIREAYIAGRADLQSEKTVEVEKLRRDFYDLLGPTANFFNRFGKVEFDKVFDWFLPHLQPSGTDDLTARMAQILEEIKPILVRGQNFMEAGAIRDILTEFKNNKQP